MISYVPQKDFCTLAVTYFLQNQYLAAIFNCITAIFNCVTAVFNCVIATFNCVTAVFNCVIATLRLQQSTNRQHTNLTMCRLLVR